MQEREKHEQTRAAAVTGGGSGGGGKGMKMTLKKAPVETPVSVLVSVVRRSLAQFIVNDHSLEEAWLVLLKAFRRFDPLESGKVGPRDFCLAVNVLLDGDEVLLNEAQWSNIVEHFSGGS
jgi:hypothetical protein